MIGYTISPLDSNESILEKLNKLEKYLKDNKMYNLYTSSFVFYNTTDNIIPDTSITNVALNTISVGDLILYTYNGATVISTIIAVGSGVYTVDRLSEKVLFYDTVITNVQVFNDSPNSFHIEITDSQGNLYTSDVCTIAGGGSGISTIEVNESSGTAQIVITDTDNVQYTSNSFTVGEQNTDTLIDTITVTESSGTATITIEDTAGNQYTSNSFNVGGGGGSETVYVDSDENVVSSNIYNVSGNTSVILGFDATTSGDNSVAIGRQATSKTTDVVIGAFSAITTGYSGDNSGTAIGYYSRIKGMNCIAIGASASAGKNEQNDTADKCIAIGIFAVSEADNAVQIGEGTNTTPNSFQFKSHQIASEESTTLKLSNELQLNNHLITIISITNDFATASANGIQVTVDQNDSTHEQVQNLNHPTTDTSIIEDEQILAIYNYNDMSDPDNPVSEFTLCYAMFMNYDSVNNVCDCMLLRMGPTQTL